MCTRSLSASFLNPLNVHKSISLQSEHKGRLSTWWDLCTLGFQSRPFVAFVSKSSSSLWLEGQGPGAALCSLSRCVPILLALKEMDWLFFSKPGCVYSAFCGPARPHVWVRKSKFISTQTDLCNTTKKQRLLHPQHSVNSALWSKEAPGR